MYQEYTKSMIDKFNKDHNYTPPRNPRGRGKGKKFRYPDFDLIPTSHLLDSIWIKKDKSELKIVFATGQILEFRPLAESENSL